VYTNRLKVTGAEREKATPTSDSTAKKHRYTKGINSTIIANINSTPNKPEIKTTEMAVYNWRATFLETVHRIPERAENTNNPTTPTINHPPIKLTNQILKVCVSL
jgi:hypothetical protein